MQDNEIVALFLSRDETAIEEAKTKYSRYLYKIAYNILGDNEDCEECLSDVWLGTWNSIPPQEPSVLQTYLAKITRRQAISILRKKNRDKRRASEYAVSLEELGDCLSDGNTPESEADVRLLSDTVNAWLHTLSKEQQAAFIGRYYFSDPIREIAKYLGMSETAVKSLLYRLRVGLKEHLEKEEIL